MGDAGVIIPDFDPHAMAQAIADLAADPHERVRLGAMARVDACETTSRIAFQVPKIRCKMNLLVDR